MATLRQHDEAERDLMRAEHAILEEQARGVPVGGCPTDTSLRRFASGHENREKVREEILIHLAVCHRCVRFMGDIRRQRIARRIVLKRSVLAFAALIIVAVGLLIWNRQPHENPISNQVAIVDLRPMAPTRGSHSGSTIAPAKVSRQTGQLRLLLPVGSEGDYQASIFRELGQGTPLLSDSGRTNLEEQAVALGLKLKLADLKPGTYWLGLRRNGSDWVFFPLSVE